MLDWAPPGRFQALLNCPKSRQALYASGFPLFLWGLKFREGEREISKSVARESEAFGQCSSKQRRQFSFSGWNWGHSGGKQSSDLNIACRKESFFCILNGNGRVLWTVQEDFWATSHRFWSLETESNSRCWVLEYRARLYRFLIQEYWSRCIISLLWLLGEALCLESDVQRQYEIQGRFGVHGRRVWFFLSASSFRIRIK
jgi:hypothetical protein